MTDASRRPAGRSKILIVDDHAIFREGLIEILKQDKALAVCGEAANAETALELAGKLKPDLVTVDVSLEGASGLVLTKELRGLLPDVRILVLSMHKGSVYAERALKAGANGYVMKQETGRRLLEAIHGVMAGQTVVSESIGQALLQGISRPGGLKASAVDALSASEFEVFKMVAEGFGTRQIADSLKISIKTVESHRGHMRKKLRLGTTFELVQYARDWAAAAK